MAQIAVRCEMTIHVEIDGKKHKLSREGALHLVAALQAAVREGAATERAVPDLISAGESAKPGMKYGPWAQMDEHHLRSALGAGRPIENVAKTLGRTVTACEKKAAELGIELPNGPRILAAAAD